MAAKKKPEMVEQPDADGALVGEHGPELARSDEPTRVERKDEWVCAVAGCDRPNVLHRLCDTHNAERRRQS